MEVENIIRKKNKQIVLCLIACLMSASLYLHAEIQIPDSIRAMLGSDNPKKQIDACQWFSDEYYYNDSELSLEYLLQAIDIAKKNDLPNILVQLYINTGIANIDKSNYIVAEVYYQKALDLAIEINDTTMLPNIYGNFGNINMYMGDYEKAISLFIKAYKLFERAGNELGMVKALGALGNLNLQLPDYEQAVYYYEKAYIRFRKIGNTEGAAITLMNLGICYANLSEYEKADEKYKIAYDELMNIGNKYEAAQCLANRAIVFQNTNRYTHALRFSEKAYRMFDEFGNNLEKASCIKDMGVTFFQQGLYNQALEKFLISYELMKDSKKIGSIEILVDKIVRVYDSLRNYQKAYEYSNILHGLIDSLYNAETHKQIVELRNKFELGQKEKEIEIKNLQIEKQNNNMERFERERWFYILLFILLVFVAWSFFNRFKLKQKHKQEKLMLKNIEIEQHLLRSQMNPHFIFNSLNSIQGLISCNDSYQAEVYLSKFAQLVRSILENSKKTTVSLSEDISNLKLYIDLESMRFGDSFEYKLIIDPLVDAEEVVVPPLLVQPFVENSIKHGLIKLSDRKGEIRIDYFRQGNSLVCTVEDNGIGRAASAKLKNRNSNHKSLGMKVTQERLDSLNKQFKSRASAEITDLFDKSGNACGTKIVVKIPYLNL